MQMLYTGRENLRFAVVDFFSMAIGINSRRCRVPVLDAYLSHLTPVLDNRIKFQSCGCNRRVFNP